MHHLFLLLSLGMGLVESQLCELNQKTEPKLIKNKCDEIEGKNVTQFRSEVRIFVNQTQNCSVEVVYPNGNVKQAWVFNER